ncbi:hypothetical protein AVEN_116425-1 [Araneus ventricosus]|uniref:Uncharacterized protein n=1 Tax=Araneus ventricosus TaxID=182803 RepID=A0A4Y2KK16_ARAVE|nr:hypothetical protein AVEN_116425-1 [Araneus ventricosus]
MLHYSTKRKTRHTVLLYEQVEGSTLPLVCGIKNRKKKFEYIETDKALKNIVTSMEGRFPAMLVLWLGRAFYRGIYGNTGGMEPFTPTLAALVTKCRISKILEFS